MRSICSSSSMMALTPNSFDYKPLLEITAPVVSKSDKKIRKKEIFMKRAGILAPVFVLVCSLAVLAADGPSKAMLGTWKLDTARSKYSPGPVPKSQVAKLEEVDGALKTVSDRVEAD